MALRYNPISLDQDAVRNLLAKGNYPFIVKSIIEKKTKNGNHDMLEVELGIIDANGKDWTVKDWVVIMDEMAWKLRHFADTCGLLKKYEDRSLDAKDFLGKKGVAKIGVKDYESGGEMRKTNCVTDYIKADSVAQIKSHGEVKKASVNQADDFLNDNIPF